MAKLSSELIYNDLTGAEVKEILATRFLDLLNQVSDFSPHICMTRVRMQLSIHLDIAGRTPPNISIPDDVIVATRSTPPYATQDMASESDLSATIDSAIDPPDQVREEHGLPTIEPVRGPFGIEDRPVTNPAANKYPAATAQLIELRGNQLTITQDFGPSRVRDGSESLIAVPRNTHRTGPAATIQPDFVDSKKRDSQ